MNNPDLIPIKRALISVSDKTDILTIATQLHQLGVEIISTGGTAKQLQSANLPVTAIQDVTHFPEMMHGRVKTLHPHIHGAILGDRQTHQAEAEQFQIDWIDLVICNLYPFEKTIKTQPNDLAIAIENIDIGGPTMIRAAAKNFAWVSVLTDPEDYPNLILELDKHAGQISYETRRRLSAKAFQHTAYYDGVIASYLQTDETDQETWHASYRLHASLRYGENPHQSATVYQSVPHQHDGILQATQLQGKALSYNNIMDADGALNAVTPFDKPTCVVIKHATPCGIASADTITTAFELAFEADKLSAFGGIIALNRPCNESIATYLKTVFVEVIIAPDYSEAALACLKLKKNLRVIKLSSIQKHITAKQLRPILGGMLIQEPNNHTIDVARLKSVTNITLSPAQYIDLQFAWQAVQLVKSNAIVIVENEMTVGIGGGQVSRVDAVDLALKKSAGRLHHAVLASDAFFPFRDSIDKLADTGIKAIIQPGGSIKDDEVIEACNQHGIAMIFTGIRAFKH